MDYLMVIDNATGERRIMCLADAADFTLIDASDIEHSIADFGVCISLDHTILDTEEAEEVLAL